MSSMTVSRVFLCGLLFPLAAAATPLVIAVSQSPSSLPLYVAEQQGYFAVEGVQAKIFCCAGGQRCLRMMLAGKAELATVSELPIVMRSFRNGLCADRHLRGEPR